MDKTKGAEAIEKLIKQQNATQGAVIKGFIPDFNKIKSEQAAIVGLTGGAVNGRMER
jgi:hypothetical protein